MADTGAATELRMLYIRHKVFDVLNIRIFSPFLFTLGRRYGGVDTFLQTLSADIRAKSIRREAMWRQTTLRAAYTVSQAKQAINVVAAVVVDEIMEAIKGLTSAGEHQSLMAAVQSVVKAAAEIWRYARVERDLIKASWPSPAEQDNNVWHEICRTNAEIDQADGISDESLLLRVTPHIIRETHLDEFSSEEDRARSTQCIFLQGCALYGDSPVLHARLDEMSGIVHDTMDESAPDARDSSRPLDAEDAIVVAEDAEDAIVVAEDESKDETSKNISVSPPPKDPTLQEPQESSQDKETSQHANSKSVGDASDSPVLARVQSTTPATVPNVPPAPSVEDATTSSPLTKASEPASTTLTTEIPAHINEEKLPPIERTAEPAEAPLAGANSPKILQPQPKRPPGKEHLLNQSRPESLQGSRPTSPPTMPGGWGAPMAGHWHPQYRPQMGLSAPQSHAYQNSEQTFSSQSTQHPQHPLHSPEQQPQWQQQQQSNAFPVQPQMPYQYPMNPFAYQQWQDLGQR